MSRVWFVLAIATALAGCTTPFRPAVPVYGGHEFSGLVDLANLSSPGVDAQPVDVVLVHGMCTRDDKWANGAIDSLVRAVDPNAAPKEPVPSTVIPRTGGIRVVKRTETLAGGVFNFSALIWSPVVAPLKEQLDYDRTGQPTNCALPGECKPKRALLNGKFKDGLLNDCLADALAYQGLSRKAIRDRMVEAITNVESSARLSSATQRPLVLITDSLGSKLTFDALAEMLSAPGTERSAAAGESATTRLVKVFMNANQLPILGLADQDIGPVEGPALMASSVREDSLQRLLNFKSQPRLQQLGLPQKMSLVAFTDPNDLLSYRLLPARFTVPGVEVSDVLVSNDTTYFGLLERPDTAHTEYDANPEVRAFIACGRPKSPRCK